MHSSLRWCSALAFTLLLSTSFGCALESSDPATRSESEYTQETVSRPVNQVFAVADDTLYRIDAEGVIYAGPVDRPAEDAVLATLPASVTRPLPNPTYQRFLVTKSFLWFAPEASSSPVGSFRVSRVDGHVEPMADVPTTACGIGGSWTPIAGGDDAFYWTCYGQPVWRQGSESNVAEIVWDTSWADRKFSIMSVVSPSEMYGGDTYGLYRIDAAARTIDVLPKHNAGPIDDFSAVFDDVNVYVSYRKWASSASFVEAFPRAGGPSTLIVSEQEGSDLVLSTMTSDLRNLYVHGRLGVYTLPKVGAAGWRPFLSDVLFRNQITGPIWSNDENVYFLRWNAPNGDGKIARVSAP